MVSSRLIKSNNTAAGCVDIVDAYDPFAGNGVALYQLNGNANDVSGNYNGTATNVTYGAGEFGQAGVFNGSSSVLTAPRSFSTSSAYSVSGWMKITSSAYLINCFYWQASGTDISGFYFESDGSGGYTIHLEHKGAINNAVSYTLPSQPLGFNHYTASFDGSKGIIYINGVAVATGNLDSKTDISSTLYIGGGYPYNNITYYRLVAGLDQVRIFNTALDPLEVEALYIEQLCICDGTVDTLDILGDSSCIATYQLDGNANDLSGNYSGTPTAVSYGVGEFDLAGVFNGSNYIIIGSVSGLFNSKTTSTVSLWFKSTETAVGGNQWLFADYTSTSFNYVVYLNNPSVGKIRFLSRYSSATTTTDSVSTGLNNGNWHHLVVMVDIANLKHRIYIDGNFEAEGNLSSNAYNGSGALGYIGGGVTGSIDQVRIFNKALNATEVTTLYNETACTPAACTSGTTNTLNILGDGSCIATYTLDGSPADLSGNYNGVQTDVTYPQGYFDLAGVFNGTSSRFKIDNIAIGITNTLSVSSWVKTNSLDRIVLFASNVTASTVNEINYNIIHPNGNYYISFGTVANRLTGAVPSSWYDGNWHNFVISKSSTHIYLYVDNNLYNSKSLTDTVSGLTNGEINGYTTNSGGGQIDQVRIFNKALSAGEVTTLYNETPCN